MSPLESLLEGLTVVESADEFVDVEVDDDELESPEVVVVVFGLALVVDVEALELSSGAKVVSLICCEAICEDPNPLP